MASSWRSFLDPGHLSPYFRLSPTAPAPTVTNDDYHYLGPDDIVDPPRPRPTYNPGDTYFHGNSTASTSGSGVGVGSGESSLESPDILMCRHKNATYPLHFPAFCIGEGVLRVHELRKRVAKELRARSPRHVRLYYKAKELRDDGVACREEGLKQNSEIMCVLSDTPAPSSSSGARDSSESADEEDILRAERERSDGQQGKKRKGHRGGKKGKKAGGGGGGGVGQADNYSTSETNTPGSSTPPAPALPVTAMERLNVLTAQFRDTWEPQCRKLMARPLGDAKTREFEYKKLSELLLTQILMKADAVLVDGNDEARARRRAIVKEAQALLNEMDAWMKK